MAIIYTYPDGPSPLTGEELIVISDPNNSNSTRNVTAQNVANLVDINITFNPGTTGLNYSPNITQLTETVTLSGVLQEIHGGTGIGVGGYTTGDMLYADAVDSLSVIGIGATGHVLTSNGTIPTWSAIPVQPTEDLATTLAAGNFTDANDIVMSTQSGLRVIRSDNTVASQQVAMCFIDNPTGQDSIKIGDPLSSNGGQLIIGDSLLGAQLRDYTTATDYITFIAQGSDFNFKTTGALAPGSVVIEDNLDLKFQRFPNTGTLNVPVLSLDQTYDLPDQSGTLPVGPAWNSLISTVTPGGGQDGYVITWNDASNEYQLLAAGAGSNGIYSGSGSLPVAANVATMASGSSLKFSAAGDSNLLNIAAVSGNSTIGIGGINANRKLEITTNDATHYYGLYVENNQATSISFGFGIGAEVNSANNFNTGLVSSVAGGLIESKALDAVASGTTKNIAGRFSATSGTTNYAIIADNGQSGFGTTAPDPSAIVDISSTTQGFLPPRMTTAERDLINSGTFADGLVIYNTDNDNLEIYDASSAEWGTPYYNSFQEDMTVIPTPTAAAWTVAALGAGYENKILEVTIQNSNNTSDKEGGVRGVGSALSRLFLIGRRSSFGTIQVKTNSSGEIEYYAEDADVSLTITTIIS